MTDAPRRPENCTCRGNMVFWCQPCLDSGWLDALGHTRSANADLIAVQRMLEARAYQTTLDEAGQRRIFPFQVIPNAVTNAMTPGIPHPPQLIDTWSAHQADKARIAALERELAAMTKEMAYANQRMTVAIQTSNQLLDAEVARRKAAAIVGPQPVARTFPARAMAPQRGDGWIMVR